MPILYDNKGNYDKAEPLHQQALDIRQKSFGNDHPAITQSLDNLAAMYRAQGRLEDAVKMLSKSIAIWEKTMGQDHPAAAQAYHNIGTLYAATP